MVNFDWQDAHKVKPYINEGSCTSDPVVLAIYNWTYELGRYYDGDDGCYFVNAHGDVVRGVVAWKHFEPYSFEDRE